MATLYNKSDGTVQKSKLDPKLKMIANGNFDVNRIRAEFKGNIALDEDSENEVCRSSVIQVKKVARLTQTLKKGDLEKERPPDSVFTNVFVDLAPEFSGKEVNGYSIKNRLRNQAIVKVPINKIETLADDKNVLSIESSQQLKMPRVFTSTENLGKPVSRSQSVKKFTKNNSKVLIGIIDVGGFDFTHEDFINAHGKSRFLEIWDQGTDFRKPPDGFDYGSVFKQKDLDSALESNIGVHPRYIERQSQMTNSSHATHVASIAAGNSGICATADIVGVTIALHPDDTDRRKSFYDSTRLADAITYLFNLARDKEQPISINISLGTNGHAHDGSSPINRWVDHELSVPGRSITVAAGNAGQEDKLHENDFGYISGRIHTSGNISHRGLSKDVFWQVVGNGIVDISENELEIWYESQDRFSVQIRPPGGSWIGPIGPNDYIENQQLKDGSFISIYSELFHPSNGKNYIGIFLSPNLNDERIIGIPAGVWQIRILGDDIRDGTFHAWIERDDPRRLGRIGEREAWSFPSYFTKESNVDESSVSSLACSANVIAVGNYDSRKEAINASSSQGPTIDGRMKPEIMAPGTEVIAAKGFTDDHNKWIGMTGTSMASPFVCGVAALMLGIEERLTAAQIAGIMRKTSKPLPGMSYSWRNDTGFGRIDIEECLKESASFFERTDMTLKKRL